MSGDCHIETHLERSWRKYAGGYRGAVVHTPTGRVLYVTWPYASEQSAQDAARRWMARQRQRNESLELFGSASQI